MNKAFIALLYLIHKHDGEITHKWRETGYGTKLDISINCRVYGKIVSIDYHQNSDEYLNTRFKNELLSNYHEGILAQLTTAIEERERDDHP